MSKREPTALERIDAARDEGYKAGLIVGSARAEAATVPCGVCGGTGYEAEGELGLRDQLSESCQAPGCVNGRVDARLDAVLRFIGDPDDGMPSWMEDQDQEWARKLALAKYGPESKETG